uniref:Nucleoside diphosphate kinase B n=1 Tax=Echeneis naucrates TaxID=173247 RepID=A0A665UWE4_ECHNA
MILFQSGRGLFNTTGRHFFSRNQHIAKCLVPGSPSARLAGHRSCSGVQERTLIAVKPDGVQRRLVGQIIQRFEQRGFKLVGLKMVQVWEGHNVVQTSRSMVGHTNPAEARAGTVRGDFSIHVSRNVVHASDSQEGAQREIQLWFQGKELLNWDCCDQSITCEV